MPNKPLTVRSNNTRDSVKPVQLKSITFQELWNAYPSKRTRTTIRQVNTRTSVPSA